MAIRQTKQKRVILGVLEKAGRPMSPQEILSSAQQDVPLLSLATVYRVIRGLEADGTIVPVSIPGESARYETHLKAAHHHHHFHCERCSRVFDVPGCGLRVDAHLPGGYRITRHEVMLYGSCIECAATS